MRVTPRALPIVFLIIYALVVALPATQVRAADDPSAGFVYGAGPFGAGPRGSAEANRDPQHNRYAPQGCIPLPVPRDATSATLKVKIEPPTATVVFRGPHGAGGDGSVSVTGLVEQVTVAVTHSEACADSTDAGAIEVELLHWSSRR